MDNLPSSWVVLSLDRSTMVVVAINADLYLCSAGDSTKLVSDRCNTIWKEQF